MKWIAMVLICIVSMALLALCGGADGSVELTTRADGVAHLDVGPGFEGVFSYKLPAPTMRLSDAVTVITCYGDRPDGPTSGRVDYCKRYMAQDTEPVLLWRTSKFSGSPLHRWICA